MSSRCDGAIIPIIYLFFRGGSGCGGGVGGAWVWGEGGGSFCRGISSCCVRVTCTRHSSNEQRIRYDQRRRPVSEADVSQLRVSARRSLYQAGERCLHVPVCMSAFERAHACTSWCVKSTKREQVTVRTGKLLQKEFMLRLQPQLLHSQTF